MVFTVYKASDWDFKETITFNTLEELKDYQLNIGASLVINFENFNILIYDDYIE